jgi:hypothetical protein
MSGYRTYIIGAVMIGLVLAKGWGWISVDTYQEIQAILVGLGFVTLRAGIKNDCQP